MCSLTIPSNSDGQPANSMSKHVGPERRRLASPDEHAGSATGLIISGNRRTRKGHEHVDSQRLLSSP